MPFLSSIQILNTLSPKSTRQLMKSYNKGGQNRPQKTLAGLGNARRLADCCWLCCCPVSA